MTTCGCLHWPSAPGHTSVSSGRPSTARSGSSRVLTGGWCARPGFYIPKVVLARWFEPTRMCWNALPIKRRTQAVSPCESWVQTCCVPSGPVATPTVATHLEVRGPSHGQRPQKPQQAQMPQRLWLGAAHRVPGRTTADGSEPDPGFGNGFNGKAPHRPRSVWGRGSRHCFWSEAAVAHVDTAWAGASLDAWEHADSWGSRRAALQSSPGGCSSCHPGVQVWFTSGSLLPRLMQ